MPHVRGRAPTRRRWPAAGIVSAIVLLVLAAALVFVVQVWVRQSPGWASGLRHPGRVDAAQAPPGGALNGERRSPLRPPGFAAQGAAATSPVPTGVFGYAPGDGPVLGSGSRLYRFRVAVETGAQVPVGEFTALVEETLGDRRSWIGGGAIRFQRVAATNSDFTIYLATPPTADKLCRQGGISTVINGVPYTSCRVGNSVVINLDRYQQAVPDYGAPLEAYRHYVVNHEVGHYLGHNHEACPQAGRPAPVMQQQTLSLGGCVANSWPYVDGKLYSGPPGGQ